MSDDVRWMTRALELAALGQGRVEPNPMVGCVIVQDEQVVAEGFHRHFGGPHAEINALGQLAESTLSHATMYVTLEPCCHQGKTPACTQAILAAGIRRVVVATEDPFPQVAGRGLALLRAAGVECLCGCLADVATRLNGPYFQLVTAGIPWFVAKWAMSLDGRLANDQGESRWISNEQSRARVHQLRGRMDAIMVGRGTFERDNPLLTARPPGPRTPTRIVLASSGFTERQGHILSAPQDPPTIIAVDPQQCTRQHRDAMVQWGCEVVPIAQLHSVAGANALAVELGRRQMTNVLVEGGARVLGSFHAAGLLREYHVFIAPILIGGALPMSPLATAPSSSAAIGEARLESVSVEPIGDNLYWQLRSPQSRGESIRPTAPASKPR